MKRRRNAQKEPNGVQMGSIPVGFLDTNLQTFEWFLLTLKNFLTRKRCHGDAHAHRNFILETKSKKKYISTFL